MPQEARRDIEAAPLNEMPQMKGHAASLFVSPNSHTNATRETE